MNKLFALSVAALSAQLCMAWGQKGHDVTAYIAEQHLTPTAQLAVDSIFNSKSLVYWSNWLDNASHSPEYSYMSTWHYKNIDPEYNFDNAPINPHGNIVTALYAEIDSLCCGTLTPERAQLSLKIIVHLIGDLHQPMHLGRLNDRGGNDTRVIYFKRDNNLHSIWDSSIVESGHKWSYSEWQDQIDRLTECAQDKIIQGTIEDWGRETYNIAVEIYENTPFAENLSYDYVAEWTPVIEDQLEKGGLRLAHVLNSIFDPEYRATQDRQTHLNE